MCFDGQTAKWRRAMREAVESVRAGERLLSLQSFPAELLKLRGTSSISHDARRVALQQRREFRTMGRQTQWRDVLIWFCSCRRSSNHLPFACRRISGVSNVQPTVVYGRSTQ